MVRKYFRNSIFLRKTYLTFVAVKSQNAVRIRFFVELFHLLGTIGQQIFSYRKVIPCRAIQEKTHTFPFTLFTPAHDYHQKVALYLKFNFISKYPNKTSIILMKLWVENLSTYVCMYIVVTQEYIFSLI